MSKEDCIFCKMIQGQVAIEKIYENESVLAFLDIGPISDGHTLVIPKEHVERIDLADGRLLADVAAALPKIAAAVQKGMDSDGYNLLCNNGRAAGQLVEHLHFHIIPRNMNDGVFDHWPSYKYEQGKAEQIAEKIRININ